MAKKKTDESKAPEQVFIDDLVKLLAQLHLNPFMHAERQFLFSCMENARKHLKLGFSEVSKRLYLDHALSNSKERKKKRNV